jgi:hypothetical protein
MTLGENLKGTGLRKMRETMNATTPDATKPEMTRAASAVRRIVLTGFMGSGKSTVGPLVARRLGWNFVDVDDVIVEETGMAISDFFAVHGEAPFRDREHATIARLAAGEALVLALGGGAIEQVATRAWHAPHSPGGEAGHHPGTLPGHGRDAADSRRPGEPGKAL